MLVAFRMWPGEILCQTKSFGQHRLLTEHISSSILLASSLADVARDSQEYDYVVFRGIIVWIESAKYEEASTSMEV